MHEASQLLQVLNTHSKAYIKEQTLASSVSK